MTEVALETRKEKFSDPDWTATGARRAQVPLDALRTLWINTGSLCNIECRNCYIESGPENDRLAYISRAEVAEFLDEIARDRLPTREIGFTGGVRGKFYRSDARLNLPVYLDADVQAYLSALAAKKGVALSELANDLLKKDIEILESGK